MHLQINSSLPFGLARTSQLLPLWGPTGIARPNLFPPSASDIKTVVHYGHKASSSLQLTKRGL